MWIQIIKSFIRVCFYDIGLLVSDLKAMFSLSYCFLLMPGRKSIHKCYNGTELILPLRDIVWQHWSFQGDSLCCLSCHKLDPGRLYPQFLEQLANCLWNKNMCHPYLIYFYSSWLVLKVLQNQCKNGHKLIFMPCIRNTQVYCLIPCIKEKHFILFLVILVLSLNLMERISCKTVDWSKNQYTN